MNCKQARRLMHEILDGAEMGREGLEQHVAQCPACRAELRALQATETALQRAVNCQAPSEPLERAMNGALYAIKHQGVAYGGRRWLVVGVAVGVLAAFCVGLFAGRSVWPREVIQVNRVREVVEKVVKVEVPVVKERVVVKRVPVVRTRVVYREREAPPLPEAAEMTPPKQAEIKREPVVPEQYEIRITSNPISFTCSRRDEVRLAAIAEDEDKPETVTPAPQEEQSDEARQDAAAPHTLDGVAVAQAPRF